MVLCDVVEEGTSAVGGGEDLVSDGSRWEDVHATHCFHGGGPDGFAVGGEDAAEEVSGLYEDLVDALDFGAVRGGEGAAEHGAFIGEGLPDGVAVALFNFAEGGAYLDVEVIGVEEGGGDEAERGKGCFFFGGVVAAPFFFSGGQIEGDEDIAHASDEECFAIGGRSGTNPRAIFSGVEGDAHGAGPGGVPDRLTGFAVEGADDFLLLFEGFDGDDLSFGDDGAGIAFAEVGGPE